jgi:hypothetical protein
VSDRGLLASPMIEPTGDWWFQIGAKA